MDGPIVLDVSRLLSRAERRVPTGIDRVEHAYAEGLLRVARDRLRYAAVHPLGRFCQLPTARTRRFVERIGQEWQEEMPTAPGEGGDAKALGWRLQASMMLPRVAPRFLGAGRGRFLFAAAWCGAKARGCDLLTENVVAAGAIVDRIGARLEIGEASQYDVGDADMVYLAWTTWERRTRTAVVAHLATLPIGARVVVITWPIDDVRFAERASFRCLLSWGLVDVLIYERVEEASEHQGLLPEASAVS